MKRVKAGCILQTLVFSQKPDCGLTLDQQLALNREEAASYRSKMECSGVRCQISASEDQFDGSVIVRVRKQYNAKADVSGYFC